MLARSQRPVRGLLCPRLRRRERLHTCLVQPLGVPLRTAIQSGQATDCRLRSALASGKKKPKTAPRGSLSLDKMSLANSRSSLCLLGSERRKRRGPCPGAGSFCEPGCHPPEVDRGGEPQMQQPSLHQPAIA
jgi:hypothetical protein